MFKKFDFKKCRITFSKFKREELLCIAAFNNIQSVPMWNKRKHTNTSPRQLVCYMKHKQLLPTRADVVKETLKRSKVVVEECGNKYALATYGLAIAKMVNRIQ